MCMLMKHPGIIAMIVGILVISLVVAQQVASFPKYTVSAKDIQDIQLGKRTAIDVVSRKSVEARIIFHHQPGHSGGPPSGGGSTCFAFLANGARWKITEPYVLDKTNQDGMSSSFVSSATATSLETLDEQVAFDIFGNRDTGSSVDGPDTQVPDGKNEIMFGVIGSPGTIGVTIVWGIFRGPSGQREIVEYDTVFNDPDYVWGDATVNQAVMDYQNIAVHEFGHSAGLGHPSDACKEETMYRFATVGETKKRDLHAGDIAGINDLY